MKLKLKEGILIQEVAGEKILMASGMEEVDYSRMIVLNPSAALLAEALIERSCTLQQLLSYSSRCRTSRKNQPYSWHRCRWKKTPRRLCSAA